MAPNLKDTRRGNKYSPGVTPERGEGRKRHMFQLQDLALIICISLVTMYSRLLLIAFFNALYGGDA